MSLARKLTISIVILLGCIALIGVAALVGLRGLSANFSASNDQHRLLRGVYEVGHHAASVRLLMSLSPARTADVDRRLDAAIEEADALIRAARTHAGSFTPADFAALERMLASLHVSRGDLDAQTDPAAATAGVNAVLAQITGLAGALQDRIEQTQRAGRRRLALTIITIVALLALTMGVAITTGVIEHRSVMGPIRALESATARIGEGEFTHRLTPSGEIEFRRLAERFNAMAQELGRSYESIRAEVEAKSKQLVRSQQLAAVGRLAAGFAHEINNPIGIIAGYAEATQRRLARSAGEDASVESLVDDTSEALQIIAEEAFRCRKITDSLLCAARPEAPSERVDVVELIDRLREVLGGLPQFADREFVFHAVDRASCVAVVNSDELTQVLWNVITNAMEAVEPGRGRVMVEAERRGDRLTIRVSDNGRGMSAQTLARVFEPFYTDKLDRGQSGSGLGLAVCHALMERMGGRIDAQSDGVGRGSVFTIELPTTSPEPAIHA